jgi:hypothetical protein
MSENDSAQKPSLDEMLEAVIVGIQNELMPFLSNEKAVATAAMLTSIVQGVRQAMPVRTSTQIAEHNAMIGVLRQVAELIDGVPGDEAVSIRRRAATLGNTPPLPPAPNAAAIDHAHQQLTRAIEQSLPDLDVIQRAGGKHAEQADAALQAIRAHLAPRYLNLMLTMQAGQGFVGRG